MAVLFTQSSFFVLNDFLKKTNTNNDLSIYIAVNFRYSNCTAVSYGNFPMGEE